MNLENKLINQYNLLNIISILYIHNIIFKTLLYNPLFDRFLPSKRNLEYFNTSDDILCINECILNQIYLSNTSRFSILE